MNEQGCAVGAKACEVVVGDSTAAGLREMEHSQGGFQSYAFNPVISHRLAKQFRATAYNTRIQPKSRAIGDVRSRGLIAGLDFVSDPPTQTPAERVALAPCPISWGQGCRATLRISAEWGVAAHGAPTATSNDEIKAVHALTGNRLLLWLRADELVHIDHQRGKYDCSPC